MSPIWSRLVLSNSSLVLVAVISASGCSGSSSSGAPPTAQATGTSGAEQAVGERLFLETRFAQAFKAFLDAGGNVNDPNAGDSVVDSVETLGAPIMNEAPFKGLSMNCRSCHFVDDVLMPPGGGMRTYTDFAKRSPDSCQSRWQDTCAAQLASTCQLGARSARRRPLSFRR